MNEEQKLELIMHLAQCGDCRDRAYRTYQRRHGNRREGLLGWLRPGLRQRAPQRALPGGRT